MFCPVLAALPLALTLTAAASLPGQPVIVSAKGAIRTPSEGLANPAAPRARPKATPGPASPRKDNAPNDDALSPREAFERGRVAFDRGEFQRAIELLRPQLYPDIRLEEESQVVRSHRMLAVAHLFENQPDEARQEFLRLLELRPDYRFDPLLDPPRVVEFFTDVMQEQEAELAALERRRKQAEEAERKRSEEAALAGRVVERQFVRHSIAVALIPFGAGQFQNGDRRKGWAFLASEATLATISVAAFTTNLLLYGTRYRLPCRPDDAGTAAKACDPAEVDRSAEQTSSKLLNVQLISGGLFFGVAAWGIVDALINFEEVVPLEPRAGAGQPGVKVSLFPFVTPGSFGPGMSLRF